MTPTPNRHDSILDTIGATPTVRLNHLAPPDINVYVKLEASNPMASVKDRLALAVIEAAERSGRIEPGQTVVEATSGNTGIGLAMVCAQKGYPLVIVMAENFSVERRRLLRFLGAKVVLTPASERGTGMVAKAEELAAKHGWFLARQFENEANVDMHSRTTAREILADFDGDRLDAWVSGYGTGGTLKGVARVLRAERPDTLIVACEPDNSALLGSGIDQPRSESGTRTSHPAARPHPMQGWGPDFLPQFAEDAHGAGYVDRLQPVGGAAALETARQLATREGIFCGISGGATLAGALEVARTLEPGSNVVCMLPDTGERYMTTALFDHVGTEMDDDERAIAASTPSCRFDAPPPAAPAPATVTSDAPVDVEAAAMVDELLSNADEPVVMFALEWCEFCWSARKMLGAAGIGFRSVDLDSVACQPERIGARIRTEVNRRTGWTTIPQIFVGGEFVGGCTDLFDGYNDGSLKKRLAEVGIEAADGIDPYAFLPGWLAKRGAA